MRKTLLRMVLILVLSCTLVLPVMAADDRDTEKANAVDIKNKSVTDSLEQIDSVRWYKFTLENTADVVIRLTSDFTTEGDYWFITVYKDGEPYSVTSGGVGASSLWDGDVLMSNKNPGTYYIRVQSYAEGSPGTPDKYYTAAPYTLEVITEGYTCPTGTAQRKTVSKAGEIIAVIGGNVYIKQFDGEAYVACYVSTVNKEVESAPILLSENEKATGYYTPQITDTMRQTNKLEWEGKTYYYSSLRDGYQGSAKDDSLYQCCEGSAVTGEEAANDLFKLRFGVSPLEESQKEAEAEDRKGTIWAIVVIAAICVFGVVELIVICVGKRKASKHYGSSGWLDESDRAPTAQDMKDLDDMSIAQGIAQNANTPGYEADGPSTGSGGNW